MKAQHGKILIIAEKAEIRGALVHSLGGDFDLEISEEGLEGFFVAKTKRPDLIVMDVQTPGIDGVDFCNLLRKNELTRDVPLVVLTESKDVDLHIKAFESGADDVVTFPFHPGELRARIDRRLMKKPKTLKKSQKKILARGSLELNEETYDCTIGGEYVRLSVLEFNILRFFLENFSRVLTREDILRSVWRDEMVSQRNIDTHIAGLRKKIQGSNLAFVSFYGVGYSLREAAPVISSQSA